MYIKLSYKHTYIKHIVSDKKKKRYKVKKRNFSFSEKTCATINRLERDKHYRYKAVSRTRVLWKL